MEGILKERTETLETIGDTVERFLAGTKNGIACLKEIYQATIKWPQESVRCSIYRDRKERFKRVSKGVYLLRGEKAASLLIHGDGRKLDEIEDNSISAIINDHPWKDEKAHTSGNQKCFADYDTFIYTQEDFNQKARVLVDGGYLAEFLPIRSFSNKKYLNQIEKMAEDAGLQYYASLIWRKAPEGVVNTGRTTKGVEQIVIFTKGKARCLNSGRKAYLTTNILKFEIDIPANKGKKKTHQAEKPIPLYEYLIEQFTQEGDVCLDQFGGSCNMVKAAVRKNRFAMIYEICQDFVKSAVERFKMIPLCEVESDKAAEPISEASASAVIEVENIPLAVTKEQLAFLRKVVLYKPDLFSDDERRALESDESYSAVAAEINEIYCAVNKKGFRNYEKNLPNYDVDSDLFTYGEYMDLYKQIEEHFEKVFPNKWLRAQYENYRLEARNLAAYCVSNSYKVDSLETMRCYVDEYCKDLQNKGYRMRRSYKLLCEFLSQDFKLRVA